MPSGNQKLSANHTHPAQTLDQLHYAEVLITTGMGIISQLTQHSVRTPWRLQAEMETIHQRPLSRDVYLLTAGHMIKAEQLVLKPHRDHATFTELNERSELCKCMLWISNNLVGWEKKTWGKLSLLCVGMNKKQLQYMFQLMIFSEHFSTMPYFKPNIFASAPLLVHNLFLLFESHPTPTILSS